MAQEPDARRQPTDSSRRTPYELVFAEGDFESAVFPRIAQEAEERGVDAQNAERFAFLSVVGEALRTVLPEDAPTEALEQYRAILFQAFNHWRQGKRVFALDAAVARYVVEAAPSLGEWEFGMPFPSVYLQLPTNLFWGSISPESVPEPVDGFFVTQGASQAAGGTQFQQLEVLMVLGIRRDRAGFSVVPFSSEAGPGSPAAWIKVRGREDGAEFETVLPGGAEAGFYSILTTTEALKLIARALWFIDGNPDAVVAVERQDAAESGAEEVKLAERQSIFRVSLGAQSEARDEVQ